MYAYKCAIIYEFKNNKTFIKVTIKNNSIECNNEIIKKDIQNKLKENIKFIEFYTSLYDYKIIEETEYWKTIKNLPQMELPIYKKQEDLTKFIDFYEMNYNNDEIDIYETSKFTKREHIFSNKEKCLETIKWEQTNPKYHTFNQLFYHAGDFMDIERYGYIYIRTLFHKFNNISPEKDMFNIKIWDKFKVDFESIKNTMDYMMTKMKKGILVAIKDNKLAVFLPFSNHNYKNDFWDELYFDDNDHKNLLDFKRTNDHNLLKKLESTVRHYEQKYHLKDVEYDRRKWVMNDCFYSPKKYEGDQNEALYEDFLTELCKNRKLPDSIFFVNLRDHGVLNKDLSDSYDDITDRKINQKYQHDYYCPIFSFGSNKNNADISIPTNDDMLRISQKFYPDDCKNGYYGLKEIDTEWKNKIDKCVFRGSATGCHIDNENIRIRASELSKKYPEYLDAGIISLNRKLKKVRGKPLQIIKYDKSKLSNFMSLDDKAKFKYILCLDGHAAAYRQSHELSLKSVVLIPDSKYYLWFSHLLKPYEHYVPVEKDLSNLIDQIKWCRENDDKCKKIAENSYLFYKKYLEKEGVYNYYSELLHKICPKNLNFKQYNKKIGIITIYRDKKDEHSRLYQKRMFVYWMNKMLKQFCDYKIVIVEQSEKYGFNIGKLKNIGFEYMNKKYKDIDNYILCDIDAIPDSDLLPYFFKITDGLNSLSAKGTRYTSDTKEPIFMGACISTTKKVFEEINGYPNNYYNWGFEDMNLIFRGIKSNVKFYKNKEGAIIDIEEVNFVQKTVKEKNEEEKETREMTSYEKSYYDIHYNKYKNNGLNNLNYKILDEMEFENNHHIIVDIMRDESEKLYPEFYNFKFELDKDEYKKFKWTEMRKISENVF